MKIVKHAKIIFCFIKYFIIFISRKKKDDYYLVDAEDFGKNCVSKCPKGTILDDSTKKCITSTKNDLIIKVVLIILFILLGAIIIFIIVFCIRRYSKRKNAADKMLNDINEGDLLILQ